MNRGASPHTAVRHALFLQGMPSPFFPRLAQGLRAQGWRTTRINLCAGDWLMWHDAHCRSYRGRFADWPAYIQSFMLQEAVTDLILLGEQRHYHREAVACAEALGVRITVTDFGYIRPDWITWERDGMSGRSRFPRDPTIIRRIARAASAVDWTPHYAEHARLMATGDLLHNFANVLFGWTFPHYRRSDRRPHPLIYTPASALRLLGNRLLHRRMHALADAMTQGGIPFYLFPLQLDFDFQLVAYSPFGGLGPAIEAVLRSFAQHAPKDSHLVLKEHPWDPGLKNWEQRMRRLARELGFADRVHYLRGGHLDTLVRESAGVVTINSTSGIRALQLGAPVLALGQAVYDVPGLTHQTGLDRFWSQATPPDPQLVQDFLTALATTVQVRGVFFDPVGMHAAVVGAMQRLLQPDLLEEACDAPSNGRLRSDQQNDRAPCDGEIDPAQEACSASVASSYNDQMFCNNDDASVC